MFVTSRLSKYLPLKLADLKGETGKLKLYLEISMLFSVTERTNKQTIRKDTEDLNNRSNLLNFDRKEVPQRQNAHSVQGQTQDSPSQTLCRAI